MTNFRRLLRTWIRKTRTAYRILVGQALEKRPLRRLMKRLEHGIKMDIRKTDSEGGKWRYVGLAGRVWEIQA
jgi:hypothetical protein